MNNKYYESPEIKIINIEPDENLMNDVGLSGQGVEGGGPGGMGEG